MYHAGGNVRIHDVFGVAWISLICNAYFLPKVFRDAQILEHVRQFSLLVGPAQQTTENYIKYSGFPQ